MGLDKYYQPRALQFTCYLLGPASTQPLTDDIFVCTKHNNVKIIHKDHLKIPSGAKNTEDPSSDTSKQSSPEDRRGTHSERPHTI